MERQRSDKKTALRNSQKFDGLPKTLIKKYILPVVHVSHGPQENKNY